jgi:uncharacterized membrane protein
MSTAALAVALVTNGLLAGLFFAFACAVVPGFRRFDDRTYVLAFRAINRAILNGWFLLVFFAAPVSAVVAAVLGGWSWGLIAAAALAVLTFLVTVTANVPRNNALDAAVDTTAAGMRAARERFEGPWARWNLLRTVTAVGALVALAVAGW